ncbi:MAG: hypothetical protein P9M07_05945 [Candidatus Aceula meridiana]|nr:hypothetical protein [Candidatus Aceula meridiana]
MAKKKNKDFSKNLDEIKKQLVKFGNEAVVLAKKGEKEIVRFSKESRLRVDAATAGVKQEHILYLIGKEYVRAGCPGEKNQRVKKLIAELEALKKKEQVLTRSIRKVKKTK